MTTNFNPFPAVYGVATTVVGYAAAHQSTIASYALGVATTVAVKAAYDQWNRVLPKEITPQERLDQEIKKLFSELLIKEWNLPGVSCSNNGTRHYTAKPIFKQDLQKSIDVVKERMQKSKDDCENSPLPNLIFQGSPGVGKTMLMESLCVQSGIGFIRLPSGTMEAHLKTGSHISSLNQIFNAAGQSQTPVYIIMDDGEQLVATRPPIKDVVEDTTKAPWIIEKETMSETIVQRRVALVNAILEESGKDIRKIGFAVTTNRDSVIDKAFSTRCHTINIQKPEEEERKQIIVTHLPRIFNGDRDMLSFFDKRVLGYMAKKTEGFTGRNIVKMLDELYACVQLDKGNIREELIDAAILGLGIQADVAISTPEKSQVVLPTADVTSATPENSPVVVPTVPKNAVTISNAIVAALMNTGRIIMNVANKIFQDVRAFVKKLAEQKVSNEN